MAIARLEHANITVSDPERVAHLLARLCGWEERWRGPSALGGWTIHVGGPDTGDGYLALWTSGAGAVPRFAKGVPLNHIGLVVDDLAAAERVVRESGLAPFNHADYAPGARFYFFDWDGIEYEVVSYGGLPDS